MKQESGVMPEALIGLDLGELFRLRDALVRLAPDAKSADVDWPALVAAVRGESPDAERPVDETQLAAWRRRVSGGRRYELSLLDESDRYNKPGLSGAMLDARYDAEWTRAEDLHTSGLSYAEAWERIRRDCRMRSVFDDDNEKPRRRRSRLRRRS